MTNDIEALEPGHGAYAAFLTHKGKMLGDLRVLDLGDELLLSCERAALQELFNMIRRYKLGSDVELHKRTMEMGELSLIGPDARRIAGADGLGPDEHDNVRAEIGGHPVVLVATDVGVDVFCDAERTEGVRGALVAAGAVEVGEAAAEVVRVEHGRPRYGVDLDDIRDPPGGRAQRARRLLHQGVLRRPGDRRAAASTAASRTATCAACGSARRSSRAPSCGSARRTVGRVTSAVVSPAHGPIALAHRAPRGDARRHARRGRRDRRGRRASRPASDAAPHATFTVGGVHSDQNPLKEPHMAAHVLVVANVTAASTDLIAAIKGAAEGARSR